MMILFCLYLFVFIFIFGFLIWWRHSCEWINEPKTKFPTRGHILLISITGLLPVFNLIFLSLLIVSFVNAKEDKELKLKNNKFNRFWFDVEDE